MTCPYDPKANPTPALSQPQSTKEEEIPHPPGHYFIGNLADIDSTSNVQSYWQLADIYGDIYRLDLPGRTAVVCSSYELVNELCDPDRFEKAVMGPLKETRALLKDGLFTAYPGEHNWYIAHRTLMPAFGPIAIRKMFSEMIDISSQMILQWDRLGPDHEIFYSEDIHPFANQMAEVLIESGKRASRLSIENHLRIWSAAHTQENIAAMHKLCDELVAERRANPNPEANDLLNAMLNSSDPVTGEKMTDENIRFNMVTFLVAGHETTSGTLSFLFYHFLNNPATLIAAQKEVDEIVGDGALELQHLPKLKYIKASLYEALRYMGPIGVIVKRAKQDTLLAGKYKVDTKMQLICNLKPFHHDPKVWGDDAGVFRPERMLNGGYERLPPNAFKPFGDGERACIGRAFTEQEMIMAVALILQRFQVEMADPSYAFHIKSTLTIKPGDFKIRVRRRPGKSSMVGIPGAISSTQSTTQSTSNKGNSQASGGNRLTILYGSQSGTCKAFAEDLQTSASNYGFSAKIETLDNATERVPKDHPVVIITPSYEGKPADNAKKFVSWLEANSDSKILENVSYAVFGVGNSDWVSTFHRVPKLIDQLFEKMGASHFTASGFVDVKNDVVGPWEDWTTQMWQDLREKSGTTREIQASELQITIGKPEVPVSTAGEELDYATVKKNIDLGGGDIGPVKKHMEVELPEGVFYRTGDYLVVLPSNNAETIKRVVKRFGITPNDVIKISGTNKTFLSPGSSMSVFDLLATRVELGTPASQRQIEALVKATPDDQRSELSRIASEAVYQSEILPKRYSILDILEDHPACKLSFAAYLDMLKPLSPRQYSISSSPLADTQIDVTKPQAHHTSIASITYDVHDAPAWSGNGRTFKGVASTYLSACEPGGRIHCFVRPTNAAFHLPTNHEIPIIMIAAGTGIAPMRGFIQERAIIASGGQQKLGPALLYFGCRHHEKDFIYSEELKQWEKDGVVSVRPAFSKVGPSGSLQYVPERIWDEREEVAKLFLDGAKIFVCGSASKLAKSTSETCKKIWLEKNPGKSEQDADEWLDQQKEDRYVSDVFE
ncbi:bifunctional P-450/NADPH-P450 reductase [Glonium stellatum]|uniref:Bifunctional cytochrome P450/NADPH--P450 reductase n=1 Tax=Glonium stellatum TaxID=574774 RepID=A0A8E2JYW0_9PEZI|nr:bifunctional P-450/NADPH-P450 reductase [Glonium stellatum]